MNNTLHPLFQFLLAPYAPPAEAVEPAADPDKENRLPPLTPE